MKTRRYSVGFFSLIGFSILIICYMPWVVLGDSMGGSFNSECLTSSSLDEDSPPLNETNSSEFNQLSDQLQVPENLYINELMADNDVTVEETSDGYSDWIELYNSGPESLNLTGMYLNDNPTSPGYWQFPNGTMIGPGEFLIVWADGKTELGGLHTPFRLNANGDSVALFASDGTTLIDSVTFKKQIRDTSYGRLPDGSQNWEYLSEPSPGRANTKSSSGNTVTLWVFPLVVILFLIIIILLIFYRKKGGGKK